ncbi:Hypothetical predicted protein, partial [Mytilus galloprovincialis]
MNDRYGHATMKERYIADAKLRRRQPGESLRDFGQAIKDLYRRGCVGLTEEYQQKFKVFLCKMQECFAKPGEEGRTNLGSNSIKLNEEKPKEITFFRSRGIEIWVRTDPAKLDAVIKIKPPSTITEVRGFLGLTSYYRKFVRSYSKIAKPLFDLTKKGHCWIWTTDCDTLFQELKKMLTSAPILAYPQENGAEFIPDTDAKPDGQIHRWIQQLSQLHMKIVHRPGVHGNADALSRIITSTSDICKQCKMPWDYENQGPEE